jgi:hypothetical protein
MAERGADDGWGCLPPTSAQRSGEFVNRARRLNQLLIPLLERATSPMRTVRRQLDAALVPFQRFADFWARLSPPGGPRIIAIQGPFIAAMKARASDEAGCLAAAAPLARRGSFNFRDWQARQAVRDRVMRHGRRQVYGELRQLLAGEIVAAFAEIGRGPQLLTHDHRRSVMDPADLFVWEVDDWLVARGQNRLVATLRLEAPHGDDRLVLMDPALLEEPGIVRDDDTGTVAGIDVDVASAAEQRAFLVLEDVAVVRHVHLRPRELKLAQVVAPKLRGLSPAQRAARLKDPTVRAELAKALGCSRDTVRVYLCRLKVAAAVL